MNSITMDIRRELDNIQVSPTLRQQIEDLLPDVEARLAEEAARQGRDTTALNPLLMTILVIGLLLAQSAEKGELERPWTDALSQALEEMVKTLPASQPGTEGEDVTTDPTLTLFAAWDALDETNDPEEIARRNRDWEQTKTNLKANRMTLRDVSHLVGEGATA